MFAFICVALLCTQPAMAVTPVTLVTPSPAALIHRAAAKMGGEAAINAVHNKRSSMLNTIYANLLQEEWPGAPHPTASREQTWTVDWDTGRYRIDRAGPPHLLYTMSPGNGLFQLDTTKNKMVQGSVTYFETDVVLQSAERLMQIALAAAPGTLRTGGSRTISGRSVSGARLTLPESHDTITMWFDDIEGYLNAVDIRRSAGGYLHALQRIEFSQWARNGDLMLPAFVRVSNNNDAVTNLTFRKTEINVALDDSLFASQPIDPGPSRPFTLKVESYSENVIRLSGPSHSSVAIREGRHTIVLEAPFSVDQSRMMLDSIHARWPQAPVTDVVVSHHHADHVAGLESIFATSAVVHISRDLTDYLHQFAVTPGDPLPHRAIVALPDSTTFAGGGETVTVYRITNTHARGLVVAYIPSQKLLFEADLVTGSPANQKELRDFVNEKKLDVVTVAPVHGPAMTWNEFVAKIK